MDLLTDKKDESKGILTYENYSKHLEAEVNKQISNFFFLNKMKFFNISKSRDIL
jgi:hypothetical protein